ncbi:CynX/NimT family MFS transporter [Alteribacillus iranensis]|uniref:MFS transporter, CP family, cyanate transporter n=1 Tax=Alteribacillus iranensis TaxID=930128 RepID=A0A1I2B4W3_9BACI|nr:MFS transporter, CP family, cyanate transporter [Alteribacillus iranensis]
MKFMTSLSSQQTEEEEQRKRQFLLIAGVIFVAFNLRPAITAVGPLVPIIREDTGMSNSAAGLLTTIPLLSFAVFSLLAPRLGLRYGNHTAIFIALLILTTGAAIRATGFIAVIFLGTAMVGIGIAICNVLLPGIIKSSFPKKVGIMTSLYTATMGLFASLGSGVSIPLSENIGLGWEITLGVWSLMALLALVVWFPQIRKDKKRDKTVKPETEPQSRRSIWSSPLAWQVTLFMGFQSFLFYSLITWIPDVLQELNVSLTIGGWMLFLLQLIGIPFSFFTPILADKLENQSPIVITICTLYIIGIFGLLFISNFTVIIISVLLMGISQGAAISLSLTLLSLRAANAKHAAMLSGMAQSFGYLLAATGPIFMGFLYDVFGTWKPFLIVLFVAVLIILTAGLKASRNRYVLPES